ncbi:MAG: C40 family peptidase [Bacteroidetes bacterium]|nr:C40 family peptidase [Bacteroidota bacterium]
MDSTTHCAMMTRSVIVLFLLQWFVCVAKCEDNERDTIRALLQSVKTRYAPDERIAVFDVHYTIDGDILSLYGEVDQKECKQAILDTLKSRTVFRILDNIVVVPSPTLGDYCYGVVIVSVADVRKEPDNRKEMVTQALMGMPLLLLNEGKQFWRVRLPDGYIGWMKRSAFMRMSKRELEQWEQSPQGIITSYFSIIRSQPSDSSLPVCDGVMGCLVKIRDTTKGWICVERADGARGYLRQHELQLYEEWKCSRALTPESIERTAFQFYGFPYLWGGTTVKGFDCSGFVQTVYKMNGYTLPRDADMQASQGVHIEVGKQYKNLKKGDLLFFGEKTTRKRNENITHVALYLDTLTFIHCAGYVRLGSFNPHSKYYDATLIKSFLRARRVLMDY